MTKIKRVTAQEFIDTRNGINKERDKNEWHIYYSRIIQDLLNQRYNIERLEADSRSKEGGQDNGN